MSRLAPILVLGVLGIWIAGAATAAQGAGGNQPANVGLQSEDGPFAEENKQLNAATDRATRRAAFTAVLNKAAAIESDPEPLVSILKNRKPEATFRELLHYLSEEESARHKAFTPSLILAGYSAGDDAGLAVKALKAYGKAAVGVLVELLANGEPAVQVAAAGICQHRVGGIGGVAEVLPGLVSALADGGELGGVAYSSLKAITLLDEGRNVEKWREWLGTKTREQLIEEIANRESEKRIALEQENKEVTDELISRLNDEIDREKESGEIGKVVTEFKESQFLRVRIHAAAVLGEMSAGREGEAVDASIEVLGTTLIDSGAEDRLRTACGKALVASGRLDRAADYINACLDRNGLSPALKLELARLLNHPRNARTLAALLKAEIAHVESHSGELLLELIRRTGGVVSRDAESAARDVILEHLSALLGLAYGKIKDDSDGPAGKRFTEIAIRTNEALAYLARIQTIDISVCIDRLLDLAEGRNGAATSALTALREALGVESARQELVVRFTAEPNAGRLLGLYRSLVVDDRQQLLTNLLGFFERLGSAPPEIIREQAAALLAMASESPAELSSAAEERRNLRDAARALIARTNKGVEAHAKFVTKLFACAHGDNDIIAYVRLLQKPRGAVVPRLLQPHLAQSPVRVALIAAALRDSLDGDELKTTEYSAFTTLVNVTVKGEFKRRLAAALKDGPAEGEIEELTALATGPLRERFVLGCIEALEDNPKQAQSRDSIAGLLLDTLKAAHPGKFDEIRLEGDADGLKAGLSVLREKLKENGYTTS